MVGSRYGYGTRFRPSLANFASVSSPLVTVFDFLTPSVSTVEGNGGTSIMGFVVQRYGDLSNTDVLNYAVTPFGVNGALLSNFPGGVFPSGSVTFAPNDTSKTIYIIVAANTSYDVDRDFLLTIFGQPNIVNSTALGTILNDDVQSTVPGSAPTTVAGIALTVQYHPNSQAAVLNGSNQVQSCADLQGLAAVSGIDFSGATIGPEQRLDALGRKYWRFSPSQALIIANALSGLNSRAITVFMVGRVHKVTRGMDMPIFATRYSSYTNDSTNTTRQNGYPLRVQCTTGTNEVPRLKSGSTDSALGGAGGKMIPGSQLQVIGVCSRTTANGGLRFYINNDVATDGSTQSTLSGTNDIGALIGAKASTTPSTSNNNNITGMSDNGFDLYEYVIIKGTLTNAQADAVAAALVNNWAIPAIDSQLIMLGDSITACIDTTTTVVVPADNIAVTLTAPGAELVPTSCRVINAAVPDSALVTYSGITGILLTAQRDDPAGPLIYTYPGGPAKNVITCNIGINDMKSGNGNRDAATHYANFVALLNTPSTGYIQRGFSVVAVTPTAIAGDGIGQGRILAYRDLLVDSTNDQPVSQFLTDVQANAGDAYDGRVSVLPLCKILNGSSGTVFLDATDAADSLYYAGDGTHHTPAAMQLQATGGDTPQYGYAGIFDLIVPPAQFSIGGADVEPEGNTGTTTFTYTVFRTGNTSGTASVDFVVTPTGTNAALATDFVGNTYPSIVVNFADGEDFKDVTFDIKTNTVNEPDKTFLVTISNPVATSGAARLTPPLSALGTILNDDAPGGLQIIDLGGPQQTDDFIRSGYGTEWTATGVATQTKKTATTPAELLTHWNSIKNNAGSFTERWEIECDWDGMLTYQGNEKTYISMFGKKTTTQGWADNGGWVKIYGKNGKRPGIANRVKGGAWRGVEVKNLILGGKWDGATYSNGTGKQSVQAGLQILTNSSYPAEPIINIDSTAFGRSFVDSTQSPDNYITGVLSSGLSEQIVLTNCSMEGTYFGAALIARKTRLTSVDFNKSNGDYMHFFGHKFKTGYFAYIVLEKITERAPIQLLAYRSLHQDAFQTGSRNDVHLGYRLVADGVRIHLDHMYQGLPGMGGGSQGSYNDDYNNADNLFCLRNSVILAASPHSFAYWSPKGSYRSYIDHCTLGRCGRVPSGFAGDIYPPEDYSPGVTGNALPSKIPGIALTVVDSLVGRTLTTDPKVQNINTTVVGYNVGAAITPEMVFNGTNFERGGASSNGMAGKFGYIVPNETGTQAQFLTAINDNFTPQGAYAGKGAPAAVVGNYTSVAKPAWAA